MSSQLLERLERQAVLLDQPKPHFEIPGLEDIQELARVERIGWKRRMRMLDGVPVAARQQFQQPEALAPLVSGAAITGGTVEVNLWTPAQYSPIPQNYAQPGMQWELVAGGVMTTAATPGTLIVTPRFGTSATPASNTTAGASFSAQTLAASLTAADWLLRCTVTCRAIGLPGANSTFVVNGCMWVHASPVITFGGTVATIDASIAQALAISITPSVTTQSWTVQQIDWSSTS